MTTHKIPLERDWYRRGRTRRLLPEGYHDARCEAVHVNDAGHIDATFVITEESVHYGRRIEQRFDREGDKDTLYELLAHLDIPENARSIHPKKLTDTPVLVCITHTRNASGAYKETITGYRAVPGTP